MIHQKTSKLHQPQGKTAAAPLVRPEIKNTFPEINNIRQKEEENEVAGRHKNDGQMGHKGAR